MHVLVSFVDQLAEAAQERKDSFASAFDARSSLAIAKDGNQTERDGVRTKENFAFYRYVSLRRARSRLRTLLLPRANDDRMRKIEVARASSLEESSRLCVLLTCRSMQLTREACSTLVRT